STPDAGARPVTRTVAAIASTAKSESMTLPRWGARHPSRVRSVRRLTHHGGWMDGRGSAIEFRIDGRAVRETGTAMRCPEASTGRVVNARIVVDAARGFDRGAEASGFRWSRARLF